MAILHYLAVHADCVVTRDELFAQFWPNQIVTADALNRVMSNIRRALGDLSNNPQYIATIRNQGYRLIAPVTVLVDPRINQHQVLAQRQLAKPSAKPPAKPSANKSQSRSSWFMVTTAILVLSLLIILFFNHVNLQRVTLDNLQRITYDQRQNIMPALSPSGESMVYIAKNQGLPNQLMMLKNAPLGAIVLSEQGRHYSYPVFGDDDDTVAAIGQRESDSGSSQHELVIFSLAENKQTLVSLLSLKRPGQGLSWHPKQDLLAYSDVHPISGKTVIFTVQRQLKQSRILTDAGAGIEDQQALFSPDGKHLAFIRHFARYEQALFITDLQGNSRRISSNYSRILSYVWLTADELLLSLDSGLIKVSLSSPFKALSVDNVDVKPAFMAYHQPTQRLVFSQINHSAQIATYALAGNKVKSKAGHLLTQSQTRDDEGSISKSGYNLAFVSDRSGQFQIWLRSGNRLSPLKSTTADYISEWRIMPPEIAFRFV